MCVSDRYTDRYSQSLRVHAFYSVSTESRRDQEEGDELDSHEEAASPEEIKS